MEYAIFFRIALPTVVPGHAAVVCGLLGKVLLVVSAIAKNYISHDAQRCITASAARARPQAQLKNFSGEITWRTLGKLLGREAFT